MMLGVWVVATAIKTQVPFDFAQGKLSTAFSFA